MTRQTVEDKKEEKIDFRHNLKVYLGFLWNYKLMFIAMIAIAIIAELTAVADKFIFKEIIDKGTAFSAGKILTASFTHLLITLLIIYILIISVKLLSKFFSMHLLNHLEVGMIKDLKTKFFNHLIHLSHGFHTSHKTGSLISRLIRGGGAVERMTDVIIFNIIPLIIQTVAVAISLMLFDMVSAAVVLVMSVAFILFGLYISNIQRPANIYANDVEDIEKANISDIFTNVDSIKYFGKERMIKQRYDSLAEKTRKAYLKNWQYFRMLDAGNITIISVGLIFLLLFPLQKLIAGQITIGTIVFIYTIYGNLYGPLWGMSHAIRSYYRSMADFDALFQYGKMQNDIKDRPNASTAKIREGTIEFRNVSFKYKKRPIFDDFTLKIPANKKVALVGPSGAGKSTIIKLLYRLYDVEQGEIRIDGKNINSFKQESFRSELSIVPQECILFDDTVYNNIAFSNSNAKSEDVFKAIRFAQLDRIIREFPNQEKTVVGERGVKLSGGEKQRVSIARAILANKRVLVLDEATSSLDSQTEHEIQKDLKELMKGRTTIIIAHRLSTIMSADQIVVMNHGRIIQKGNHNQLIKKEGLYKKLWELQKGGYLQK